MEENTKSRVLLVATNSYAGMGPYVISIVNSFEPTDNVRFFLVERSDRYYSRNIRKELLPNATIIQEHIPNKIQTLLRLIVNRKSKYSNQLLRECKENNIEIIHVLSSFSDPKLTKEICKKYKFLYTVHDLQPHEQNKVFYKEWRMNVLYKRIFKSIGYVNYLFTNSLTQLEQQKELYHDKISFYAPFPTLVTKEISSGNKIIPELKGITNYVLFFGRIEEYKGVEILAKSFSKANLPENIKLVIAGNGEYHGIKSGSIILLNRYIQDEEIANLYKNAAVVVYPYISATQSGVLSVAGYFGTPIIASSVPFFKDELGENYPLLFETRSEKELTGKLEMFFNTPDNDSYQYMSKRLYECNYSVEVLRTKLIKIYNCLCN